MFSVIGGLKTMKKLIINKIGVVGFANFMAILGAVTGAIKAIVLPVFALVASGSLADVDGTIKGVADAIAADLPTVVAFGIGGWITGAVYAWIANIVLKATKGFVIETK